MTGEQFRIIRNHCLNLSQAQLADVLGLNSRRVREIEAAGHRDLRRGPVEVLMCALRDGVLPELPSARRGPGAPRSRR